MVEKIKNKNRNFISNKKHRLIVAVIYAVMMVAIIGICGYIFRYEVA